MIKYHMLMREYFQIKGKAIQAKTAKKSEEIPPQSQVFRNGRLPR